MYTDVSDSRSKSCHVIKIVSVLSCNYIIYNNNDNNNNCPASGECDLGNVMRMVKKYSQDVGMELGLDTCTVFHEEEQHAGITQDVQFVDGSIFKHLWGAWLFGCRTMV